MPAPAPADEPPQCLNCGQAFGPPRPRFCPACGQETNVRPPRLGEFIQQFGGAYFSTEGALWRTLKLLVLQPGELTRRYFAGQRKHYVMPLRLFLSASVVMLLAMRLAGSLDFAALEDPEVAQALPERPRSVQLQLGFGQAGLDEGRFYCEGLPGWACQRLRKRLDVDTRTMVRQMHVVSDRVVGNAGTMMLLLLPLFALGLGLLYRNRGLHFTEHLVFSLHLHAFWSLVLTLAMLEIEAVTLACALLIPAYGALALRRVYGGRWFFLLLRVAVLAPVHALLIAAGAVTVTLVAVLL
ncbi:conserved membrane hypothetical protein [Rubrivivax sp. A210]|uniref:DUF3667 domain-containing protein n=1 Tax=Rubrivivax sp. A210 TaxID=2772301 RepID=UPI001918E04E|nr:DUF3667 domain-containing protein [Rubrivivax sp. A210]CAD5373239.1 conserved membrane hypothetical protein [Rubrivivax sp. A210]